MTGKRFEGKTAIVTGAARGMGRAIAQTLAREGAAVVVNDVKREGAEQVVREIEAAGGQAMAYIADISRDNEVHAMVQATVARFGTVDILVNNAGILGNTRPLEEIPGDEWDQMMAINVKGVFNCTKAVLPLMKARRSGKIVNVSSSAGRSTSTFGGAHYTTSKAAILGLTRHTAREAAPYNINVNATAPGSMDTEMVRERATPEHIRSEEQSIPLRRLGTAQDEANLVAFLCSDESSYIAGATIDINGADLLL
ncbi:MAG: SDR family oxidoreductase [Chloroflexi bacterium]|nr:SDR family oxidoreductase [Chloroflexota bacterium]